MVTGGRCSSRKNAVLRNFEGGNLINLQTEGLFSAEVDKKKTPGIEK